MNKKARYPKRMCCGIEFTNPFDYNNHKRLHMGKTPIPRNKLKNLIKRSNE